MGNLSEVEGEWRYRVRWTLGCCRCRVHTLRIAVLVMLALTSCSPPSQTTNVSQSPVTTSGVSSSTSVPEASQPAKFDLWVVSYGTSVQDGLVVFNVSLGQRLLAERMSVAYINLVTCSGGGVCLTGASTRPDIVLAPNLIETGSNDGLFTQVIQTPAQIKVEKVIGSNTPNNHLSISATYRVWLGPPDAATSSHLDVTQNYIFYQDIAEASFKNDTCEPTASIPDCARFKPEVSYQFYPGSGTHEHVQSLEVVERLHFTPDGLADRGTAFTQDCDSLPAPPCSNQLGQINGCMGLDLPQVYMAYPLCVFPASRPEAPLLVEAAAVGSYPEPGVIDNIHQTPDEAVQLPEGTIFSQSPGCYACVHLHWRWGKAVCSKFPNFPCGNGTPLLCDTPGHPYPSAYTACNANQELIGALVTYHSEETTGVSNFMSTLQGANSSDLAAGPPCITIPPISCTPTSPEGTQGSEALLQAPGACYDQSDLLSWGQCGAVTWLDDTAQRTAVSDADTGTLFAFGGWFCGDASCRSKSALFIDPLAPKYSVAGGGSITSLSPGQQFSVEFIPPPVTTAGADVYFFADLLPPGTTNIQVDDPHGLCATPFTDGSSFTAVKCAMPTTFACLTVCVTITAKAPATPGAYTNYVRAVWGSSTDATVPDGGNFRKADTLRVLSNSPSPSASPSLVSLPNAYLGTWTGTFNQTKFLAGSYPMTLTMRPGAVGSQVGDVAYASLGCSGMWTLQDANTQTVTVSEHITTPGTTGTTCIDVTLVLQLSGQIMTVEWTDQVTGALDGSAILTKVGS